jgi:hypothetical protein
VETVLLTLAVLACPIGMGLMMWIMGRGKRERSPEQPEVSPDFDHLRREHARLGAVIDRLEQRRVERPAPERVTR